MYYVQVVLEEGMEAVEWKVHGLPYSSDQKMLVPVYTVNPVAVTTKNLLAAYVLLFLTLNDIDSFKQRFAATRFLNTSLPGNA